MAKERERQLKGERRISLLQANQEGFSKWRKSLAIVIHISLDHSNKKVNYNDLVAR